MNGVDPQPNIARAIRRSRQSRASLRSRRRRSALIVGAIAVSLAGAGMWSIGAEPSNDLVQAAVTQARTLADIISQRSPGQRSEAHLTKTKHARVLAKMRPAAKPRRHEAAAPKLAMVDLNKPLETPPVLPLIAEAPPTFPVDFTPPSVGTIITPPPGAAPPGGGPPGGGLPGSGPPGGGSPPIVFPTPPPTTPVTPPPPVPEPSTWATMLLGFALVGWRMRRKPERQLAILLA